MKWTFLILILFVVADSLFSQNGSSTSKSDSLWKVWINEQLPDSTRLTAINDLADVLYKTNPDSALKLLDLEYELAKQTGDVNCRANVLQFKGFVYTRKGEYEKALEQNLASLELHEIVGRKDYIAKILLNIGNTYQYLSDFQNALDYYNRSLEVSLEFEVKQIAAKCFSSLGVIYFNYGEYAVAYEYYKNAINLFLEIEDQISLASTYNNMSVLLLRQGNFELALEYSNKSLEIKIKQNDKKAISNSYATLGTIYAEIGDDSTSLDYYQKSLSIRTDLKDKAGIAAMYNNIATLYDKMNQDSLAMIYVHQGLALFRETGDKLNISSGLINIGGYYLEAGDIAKARQYLDEGYQIAGEMRYLKMLNNARKKLFLCHFLKSDVFSANQFASTLRNSRMEEIRMNYFTLSEKEKELYFKTMESDFGLYYDFTIAGADSFPFLADTAFNTALQIKGLTLKSSTAMKMAVLKSGDSLLMAEYEEWMSLRKKMAAAYSKGMNYEELEKEANELEKNLVLKSTAFNDFEKMENLSWKEIRAFLKPNECAIEFIHFQSLTDTAKPVIYAALVVRPESEHPDVVRLCTEEDLKNILGVFQGNNLSFIEKVYGKKSEAKRDLYEKIWQPLEPFLQDVKTVYYSPSGLLHKVSFAAICKEQDVFLSDVYNFRQMGSTGNLAFENKTQFGVLENFLLMGGVEYSVRSNEAGLYNGRGEVWSYLPGSLAETNTINTYLQKKKFGINYFNGSNASEEIFKEKISSTSIVHIATHGFFFPDPEQVKEEMKTNSEQSEEEIKFRGTTNYANWSFVNNKNPLMRSGIVLANANDVWQRDPLAEGEDGILTAQEVSNLDLRNTKLVVLSACETGLGDIKGSEGVYGLQRAFRMAGVKYLIMSLWQVPDKETSEFMILFYKNLIKEKDIPTAFQKTQKVMREKYDPYYWGAFVLIE
ncbi:MAG: CHAT domain-containing protein [Crocinitomicaceae bacterium]|nr:CHAT domain-containing protein [Crocinitomicaceae bacterium]